jgi:hypothetical protein
MVASGALTCLILAGLVFVFYFMHSVYEVEIPFSHNELPEAVRTNFEEMYPGAEDPEWESDKDLFEASFTWKDREDFEAAFAFDGTWIRTKSPAVLDDLPGQAKSYLKSLDGYRVIEVEQVQSRTSAVAYEVGMENRLVEIDCFFDEMGTLLSKVRDGTPLEQEPRR